MKHLSISRVLGFLGTLGMLMAATPESVRASDELPYQIIVHPSTPLTEMPRKTVGRLFLKKVTSWEYGPKVSPVDQPPSSDVRGKFSKKVIKKSVSAVVSYWQKKIFSGRAVPPPTKGSDKAVVRYVATHPGAIGYISSSASLKGVKVLRIVD